MRQTDKAKTSTDKPGPNYMIVPKLKSHKKGAAVNYLSCCMKIEKKSVWLSCSLAWLSLAGVSNLPVSYSFLALRTQSSFFFPTVKNHPVPFPRSQCANCTHPQNGHALHLCHAMENCAEIPQLAETWQAKSTLWFSRGRAKSGAIQTCR